MALLTLVAMLSLARLYEASALPCICPMMYDPMCGDDGKTYSNGCEMSCAGHHLMHKGGCQSVVQADVPETHLVGAPDDTHICACPRNLMPVCGQDGKTYSNQCELNCAGAAFFQAGTCPASGTHGIHKRAALPCICTFMYRPVCGSDGVSYGNDCNRDCASHDAQLHGKSVITAVSNGPCPTTTRVVPTKTTTTAKP